MDNSAQNILSEQESQQLTQSEPTGALFFNVMPKNKNQGALVEPKNKTESIGMSSSPFVNFIKKYKLTVIITLGVLIIGVAVYFIVSKIGGNSYKPENLLVAPPPKTSTNTPKPTPPSQAQTNQPGFSTPQSWRDKYFPNCQDVKVCGDSADPDQDGLSNLEEYKTGTDPNNPDSDQDGLADGDEIHIFGSNPLTGRTANNSKFSDADYVKDGYDFTNDKKLTTGQIADLSAKMRAFGLHQPTINTLGASLEALYGIVLPNQTTNSSSTPASNATSSTGGVLDESLSAKQDRDTQRSSTIKNIEIGLVKYHSDNNSYPQTSSFDSMYQQIKAYLKVATDPTDPINHQPYVYSYSSNQDGSDFALTFYSEVASAPIAKSAADAVKDANSEQADIYDNQRQTDLESLRTALLLYSQNNVAGNQDYVFPTKDKYQTALVPDYILQIPKDPKNGTDYDYEVSSTFNTFTLKTPLDNPAVGTTGYLCNQEECRAY